MHLSLIFLLYLSRLTVNSKKVEILCPVHCKCDIFENLKRATCTNRSIASIESNFPVQTQILDISYNQISHFDEKIFFEQKLVSLKLLNVSHNKLSQIHWRALEGLNQVKTIDFSYNALQYIKAEWFSSLSHLEELYLRDNGFSKLDSGVTFISKSLKRLDLSQCKTTYIADSVFSQIPSLEKLDISENFLMHLDIETIRPMINLNVLLVQNNSFSCDTAMTQLADYCLENNIEFDNPCRIKPSGSNKFERIINLAQPEDEKNAWIYDEEVIINTNTTTTYQNCSSEITDKGLLQKIINLSPTLSILITFVYGIAVGLVVGCSVQIKGRKRKNITDNTYVSFEDNHLTRRYSRRFSRIGNLEERENLALKEWSIPDTTPVLNRKNTISA